MKKEINTLSELVEFMLPNSDYILFSGDGDYKCINCRDRNHGWYTVIIPEELYIMLNNLQPMNGVSNLGDVLIKLRNKKFSRLC